jgi:hypothetical protein
MFGSETIEIALGLVFFYLLLSLLVTTINEIIASALELRGSSLELVIKQMLGNIYKNKFYSHPSIKQTSGKRMFSKFRKREERRPSYMQASNFAQIVVEIIAQELETERQKGIRSQNRLHEHEDENRDQSRSNAKREAQPKDYDFSTMDLSQVKAALKELKEPENDTIDRRQRPPQDNKKVTRAKERTISFGDASGTNLVNLKETINGMGFDEETKSMLLSLAAKASGDIEVFKRRVEEWFDATMQRLSGWYTRKLKRITFGVAFGIAILFNADTFFIVQKLSHDSDARKQLVASATQYAKDMEPFFNKATANTGAPSESKTPNLLPSSPVEKKVGDSLPEEKTPSGDGQLVSSETTTPIKPGDSVVLARIRNLALRADTLINEDIQYASQTLGLGWSAYNKPTNPAYCVSKSAFICWSKRFLGWLLTALAISLGAPFWFDLLKKVISIRAAGANPDEAAKTDKKKAVG